LTTSRILLNIKGQRSSSRGLLCVFCVHDTAVIPEGLEQSLTVLFVLSADIARIAQRYIG